MQREGVSVGPMHYTAYDLAVFFRLLAVGAALHWGVLLKFILSFDLTYYDFILHPKDYSLKCLKAYKLQTTTLTCNQMILTLDLSLSNTVLDIVYNSFV